MNNLHHKTKGAIALLLVVLFSGASLVAVVGGLGSVTAISARTRAVTDSKRTLLFADGVLDDAVYRLKVGKQITAGETITFGDLSAGIDLATESGITTVAIFATSTDDLARNMQVAVSSLAPPTFSDAVTVGIGGLTMSSNATVYGDAHSNGTITGNSNSLITGNASAVGSISSPTPTIEGTRTEGAAPKTLPNIDEEYWQQQANINNDPHIGDLVVNGNQQVTYGPKKFEGSVTLNSNSTITVTGTLHITGALTLNSNTQLIVDDSLGSDGVVIIVDGPVEFSSAHPPLVPAAAEPPGYPVIVSLSSDSAAMELNSNATLEGLLYAPEGGIVINSNAGAISVVAKELTLNSNATIDFDSAVAQRSYEGGGTGGFTIEQWKEIE